MQARARKETHVNRRTPRPLQALAGLCSLALTLATQAARPLATDDSGVLDRGSCELEAVHSRDKAEGVRVRGNALQVGCGLGRRTQLSLAGDRVKAEGQRLEGTVLAAKVSLLPGDDVSWSASASVLWGSAPNEATRHAASAVNLLHTRSLGANFTLHANLGHARDVHTRRHATTWGLALEHAGWGPVALMGELIGNDLAAPAWNLGLRWTVVPEQWTVDMAYGQQMVGGQPVAWSLGLKRAF